MILCSFHHFFWSGDAPSFHGFSVQPINTTSEERIDGQEIVSDEIQVEKASLKRQNTSQGSGSKNSKKRSKHPVIGSSIIIDISTGSEVFKVDLKREKSYDDFNYCVSNKGKMNTLNLKRMNWHYIDAGEKVPAKNMSV